jgi:putative ABC transport system ATP-binding protein
VVGLFSARGLEKRYRLGGIEVAALRGVDLDITAGELLVVAGPSGSGKSTLLHLLGALDRPDAGSVEFEGRALGAMPERALTLLRRRELGFVFQAFHLVPVLSALENVEYPLLIAGAGRPLRRQRATEMLERVGLGGRMRHRPDELSGGERQRVAIARALVHQPRAVLADEPTGNLDSANAAAILDLVSALNRDLGTTFLLSTHDPSVIERAPRRLRLRDGRIVADERDASGTAALPMQAPA